jgi:AraC-like DNA-binding protein
MKHIEREITPINSHDFYFIQNHFHAEFDYPIHYHPEYEINLVFNTFGERIIGDSIKPYKDLDLVLVGSNTLHAWTSECHHNNARVITIQFARDFLEKRTLDYEVMQPIKRLLENSQYGIVYNGDQLKLLKRKIINLNNVSGFTGFINFLNLLHEMATLHYEFLISTPASENPDEVHNHSRILKACDFIQKNYKKKISVEEVASLINMAPSAFSHFFKKRTYRSFTDYVIDLRISNVCRLLLDTDLSISQISEINGFNNVSNFNKIFKLRKNLTPKDFRKIRLKK